MKPLLRGTARPDVVGMGLTVLDRVYTPDGNMVAEALGGSCGNVLMSLAALGWIVVPVLRLGADAVGDRLTDEFVEAGAKVLHIDRRTGGTSPVIVQHLDLEAGSHHFSFECPLTGDLLPRFEPIDVEDVEAAAATIARASVLYADRLSDGVVTAMALARAAGAEVLFEPSKVGDAELFGRALRLTTILKVSAERLDGLAEQVRRDDLLCVTTYGERGLELQSGSRSRWCPATPAPLVRDTSGAGDMVSVGLIDGLLRRRGADQSSVDIDHVVVDVAAGQRLAAENCAHVGARGVFRERGVKYAEAVLRDGPRVRVGSVTIRRVDPETAQALARECGP